MYLALNIVISLALIVLVLFLTTREVSKYRKDQQTRSEIYPYTKKRIVRRCWVSFCIILEILLLGMGRYTLSPKFPIWFLVYVLIIVLVALVMAVLAILDFRESKELASKSEERLFKELIYEIRQDETSQNLNTHKKWH